MELNVFELASVNQVEREQNAVSVGELCELQLALVGGGIADTIPY